MFYLQDFLKTLYLYVQSDNNFFAIHPLHIGNVWGTKSTVIVILESAQFPWGWVSVWGPKAGK